ncbi:V-set and transmembrane domain-containing protein 1 [Myotis brandtii]|uniref:V-set and transmembrane domain-containing protein 1 n=1 Tax=Myotis brandtii TaxID=109478 RepID=S7PZ30_MYOBR|nr:V-set and transmembrane domain-containing protein 1 [Myotis brandtii]
MTAGENMILQCQKPRHVIQPHMFALLKKGTSTPIKLQSAVGMETDFSLPSVTGSDPGAYSCVYYQPRAPFWASEPSDHLMISVTGLCLGYDDEHKNDTLPRPSLHASPGSMVGRGGNVTLKCQGHLQNVTFMLGKWQDPGYRREQSSAGLDAEFLLTHLQPEHAGMYFCAYKTTGSHGWSEKSEHLHLQVTDTLPRPRPSLHASPGSVVGRGGSVTLKCQGHLQNLTFMLGKWQDPGYRREQSSAGLDAEFLLTHLQPEHAGMYFCAYKTTGSHGWSEKSEHLHLQVTGEQAALAFLLGAQVPCPVMGPGREEGIQETDRCHPSSVGKWGLVVGTRLSSGL